MGLHVIAPIGKVFRDHIDRGGETSATAGRFASRIVKARLVTLALVLAACTPPPEPTTTSSTTAAPVTTATTEPAVRTGIGVANGTITLAALVPLSGTLEAFGRSVLAGHEVYWGYVNDALGGVGGLYEVRLAPLDTAYDEATARSLWAANRGDVLGISSILGSPITAAVLEEIAGEQILVAAGSQASSWSASQNVVLNLAVPTYRDQIAGGIVAGGVEEAAVAIRPPLGLLYQEGVFGDDCLAGFDQATGRYRPGEVVSYGHPPTVTEFTDDLALVREAGVETLLVCSTSQALLQIVATLDLLEYGPTLVASATSYDSSLPAALGGDGGEPAGLEMLSSLYLVGTWPPFESDAPGMKLLRDNLERYGTAADGADVVDPFFFQGYTQAATFHLILEEALAGGDLTRAGVWDARDRLGEVDFGFGAGPAEYDGDRVPVVADVLAVPAPAGESKFGMMPVGGYYPTR